MICSLFQRLVRSTQQYLSSWGNRPVLLSTVPPTLVAYAYHSNPHTPLQYRTPVSYQSPHILYLVAAGCLKHLEISSCSFKIFSTGLFPSNQGDPSPHCTMTDGLYADHPNKPWRRLYQRIIQLKAARCLNSFSRHRLLHKSCSRLEKARSRRGCF